MKVKWQRTNTDNAITVSVPREQKRGSEKGGVQVKISSRQTHVTMRVPYDPFLCDYMLQLTQALHIDIFDTYGRTNTTKEMTEAGAAIFYASLFFAEGKQRRGGGGKESERENEKEGARVNDDATTTKEVLRDNNDSDNTTHGCDDVHSTVHGAHNSSAERTRSRNGVRCYVLGEGKRPTVSFPLSKVVDWEIVSIDPIIAAGTGVRDGVAYITQHDYDVPLADCAEFDAVAVVAVHSHNDMAAFWARLPPHYRSCSSPSLVACALGSHAPLTTFAARVS
jgi:hypothetical protein